MTDIVSDNATPKYAGFNARMFAATIDMGLVALVTDDFITHITEKLFPQMDIETLSNSLQGSETDESYVIIGKTLDVLMQHQVIQMILFKNALELACIALYTIPFWIYFSSTPGKMICGISIRDAKTFAPLTMRQSFKRFFGYIISFIPLTAGFLWIGLNKKKQGLHDLLAETVAIKVPRKSFKLTRQSADR